jgi:hypothetical protein
MTNQYTAYKRGKRDEDFIQRENVVFRDRTVRLVASVSADHELAGLFLPA